MGNRRGAFAVVAAVVAIVVSACGSSAKQTQRVDVRAVASSTNAAGSARFETTFVMWIPVDDERPKPYAQTLRSSGMIDFANDRGVSTSKVDPTPTTTMVGEPAVANPEREQRWIGSVVYEKPGMLSSLQDASPDKDRWESFDATRIALVTQCGGKSFPVSSVVTGSGLPIDPGRILDDLATAGDTISNAGSADVRGVTTTHWKVGINRTATCPALKASTLPSLDVFTDSEHRLRRMVSTSPQAPELKLPPVVLTTDLFDFGVPVDVEAPPAGDVTDVTEYMAAIFGGPGKLDAGWRAVAHESGGDAFTLWFGHTTTGLRCFDLVPNPNSFGMTEEGDNAPPSHDGHASDCLSPGAPPEFATHGFVTRTTGDREQVVVAFAPGYSNGRIVREDGSSVSVPVDAETGLVDWTGPALPTIAKIEADSLRGTTSCKMTSDVSYGPNGGMTMDLLGVCAPSDDPNVP